ncbi:OPA3-like protein [Hordeum vulgare]|nr:OPA3-like protein [Hordeum vulgare]
MQQYLMLLEVEVKGSAPLLPWRPRGPDRAVAAMAALPVMKLGTLLLRTLSKPIANCLKSQAAVHPKFGDFIISIAQVQFSSLSRISFPGQGSRITKLLGGK